MQFLYYIYASNKNYEVIQASKKQEEEFDSLNSSEKTQDD